MGSFSLLLRRIIADKDASLFPNPLNVLQTIWFSFSFCMRLYKRESEDAEHAESSTERGQGAR
jgi:hypothetical protein